LKSIQRSAIIENNTKPLFTQGPPALVRLAVVFFASLVLMSADHRGRHLETVRGVMTTMLYPLQLAVDLPIRFGDWLAENVTTREALMAENEKLREAHFRLQLRLDKYGQLEVENQRLRDLLDSSAKVGEKVLIAELLAVDMDPYSRRIVLNKGTRDGVEPGQSLIDANGIMGQVVHAGTFSSNALLITDPSHALPVQLQRSGLRSVALGTGPQNFLKLSHIPNSADVREGDLLVTSGLGGRFPAGYPVGKVVSIQRDKGQPFASVLVEPMAELERNREVLLVWPADEGQAMDAMFKGSGKAAK